ncbi:M48 family metallopeptidase [Verminephrobacter aporrectodeae]|uniref:M48 family peptidase n=1 Tax=Verminephrobacter aporrectodeae subsp. tuberculatae TaxID=1110392 RepID=A0ABT3KRX2_9BURK|nr:M48 family metallopeptidase [Verminephrobacter aporrectodeae]MCW5219964.1 M48 family peptidase [Verminephrobacter aporrectodeae subsp. tuberculatae]MCW5289252.1 M48 family peptidase [Verminephrobacter aporrectodeae subsp. tuberculatae]MCW5321078.1 M48 family peptidase [Verminephrobacter aporrectodeae subsp. tuberculatae]MCW8177179.1 M48 family peptidase [Verminephrobacter aporrectodeae subsp. tuberculatae]MCW8204613.1 M48 family peptidase [Verminephrobacter aporrectodeae subsp. tuberculatae
MCLFCPASCVVPPWSARRAFLLAAGVGVAAPALAQVDVGPSSSLRKLVPADTLEAAAARQYQHMLAQARDRRALAPQEHPQLQRLRSIARRLIAHTAAWNGRARQWRWEVNLIANEQINAFCMPGGKIVFYSAILERLKLSDAEVAMVMGHEMAHALREHARERIAKTQGTHLALRLGSQWLGLGDLGRAAADLGGQLLTLQFSRSDEREADLVGLELAARGGYPPSAAVSLWKKMGQATGDKQSGLAFLSTHPSGPERIRELEQNLPKVQGLYEAARRSG